jgi:hypothetical protein
MFVTKQQASKNSVFRQFLSAPSCCPESGGGGRYEAVGL